MMISIDLLIRLPWWARTSIVVMAWALRLPGGWRLWPHSIWLVEKILQATRVEYVMDRAAAREPAPDHPAGTCLACGAPCPARDPICSACEKAGWP